MGLGITHFEEAEPDQGFAQTCSTHSAAKIFVNV